jgi:hypothetical protein
MKTELINKIREGFTTFHTNHDMEPEDLIIGTQTELDLRAELSEYRKRNHQSHRDLPYTLDGSKYAGMYIHVLRSRPRALWIGKLSAF